MTLYWGLEERTTRYNRYRIAEPEKALLDWIYQNRQDGLPTPLDEIDAQFLDPQKLIQFAKGIPRTVQQLLVDSIVPS